MTKHEAPCCKGYMVDTSLSYNLITRGFTLCSHLNVKLPKPMSKIAEFACQVLDLESAETEIPKETILSKSRTIDVVDARHLAIKLLHSKDIYPSRIAGIFGMSPRSVRHVITAFDARVQANKSLGYNLAKIRKQLGESSDITRK